MRNVRTEVSEYSTIFFQSAQTVGANCGRTYATQATFDIKVSL